VVQGRSRHFEMDIPVNTYPVRCIAVVCQCIAEEQSDHLAVSTYLGLASGKPGAAYMYPSWCHPDINSHLECTCIGANTSSIS
jgi:hypothetical protein